MRFLNIKSIRSTVFVRSRKLFGITQLLLLGVIFIHIFVLRKIVFFPYPELFIYPYLTKMGLIPYKQIFDQHFPGLMFFPINLATLGIDTVKEARILHLTIIGLNHILLFLLARRLFKNDIVALASNLLYFFWQPYYEGYVLWIEVFTTPILLLTLYVLLGNMECRLKTVLVGFLLGVSLLFKQVVLPLILFVMIFLFWDGKYKVSQICYFFVGLSIPVFYLLYWVFRQGVFRDFLFWTVEFNLTTFARMGRKLPTVSDLLKSLPVFGTGLLLPLIRGGCLKKDSKVRLVYIFFIGALFFALARYDFIHLQPALPFGVILVVYLSYQLSFRYLLGASLFYILILVYLLLPFYRHNLGERVLFFGEFENSLGEKVLSYVQKGDKIFAMGTTPHIYYLTRTLPPGNLFAFQFPWFMVAGEDRILSGIINDPPKLVIRDRYSKVQGLNLIEYMPNIFSYVEENYKVVGNLAGVEILVKM